MPFKGESSHPEFGLQKPLVGLIQAELKAYPLREIAE